MQVTQSSMRERYAAYFLCALFDLCGYFFFFKLAAMRMRSALSLMKPAASI